MSQIHSDLSGLSPSPGYPSPPCRVMSVFGTRPEIVKFAPVLQEFERRENIEAINVCTSQHTDLATPFLKEFGLRIDHDLNVMRPGQPLNLLLARILEGLEAVITREKPDYVLVQGDTTSALAGSIAAFHHRIPVGHIEAGLRSGDLSSPFPEEMNRVLIDQMSDLYFAATLRNRETLLAMGVDEANIQVTGNPVIDALRTVIDNQGKSTVVEDLLEKTDGTKPIVLTAHRRENFDGRMEGYFRVLKSFLERHRDTSLIFPVHPNPKVREFTAQSFSGVDRVHLIDPLPYPDFIRLLSRAWLIVSDSGGVQEEAPTLKVPLLVIRENTERPEAIECGAARLIGENPADLARHLDEVYHDDDWRDRIEELKNPFGDGRSGRRIADAILSHFVRR